MAEQEQAPEAMEAQSSARLLESTLYK